MAAQYTAAQYTAGPPPGVPAVTSSGLSWKPDTEFKIDDTNLDDLIPIHPGQRGDLAKMLNEYSAEDVRRLMEEFGVVAKLRAKGFESLHIRIDASDNFVHKLLVFERADDPHTLLSVMCIRHSTGALISDFVAFQKASDQAAVIKVMRDLLNFPMDVVTIEWFMMQDPRGVFSADRPRLPGQRFPGLGIGREVMQMLKTQADRRHRDMLSNKPEFFHNALFYYEFHFVNPEREAYFLFLVQALQKFIADRGLAAVSFAVHCGCVAEEGTGQKVHWCKEEMFPSVCVPTSGHMATVALWTPRWHD